MKNSSKIVRYYDNIGNGRISIPKRQDNYKKFWTSVYGDEIS